MTNSTTTTNATAGLVPNLEANDPSRKGERASGTIRFGADHGFSLFAAHTRFDRVAFFVDFDEEDELGLPTVVAQSDTEAGAIEIVLAERCRAVKHAERCLACGTVTERELASLRAEVEQVRELLAKSLLSAL